MALFGKALGNGYAISAIIGKRSIMEVAQSTFISSTFWTERIGPSAALATLKVMERIKSWDQITNIGLNVRENWQKLADKHNLKINHWGLPALTGFSFESDYALAYKTIITQEMMSQGFLASNIFYASTEHNSEIVNEFMIKLDKAFELIAECENGRDFKTILKSPVCHSGFKRLN